MVKVEVIEKFTLKDFTQLKNIERKGISEDGRLFVGDVFECNEEMADYLTGNNPLNKPVVKVLETIPEEKKEVIKPEEPVELKSMFKPIKKNKKKK